MTNNSFKYEVFVKQYLHANLDVVTSDQRLHSENFNQRGTCTLYAFWTKYSSIAVLWHLKEGIPPRTKHCAMLPASASARNHLIPSIFW